MAAEPKDFEGRWSSTWGTWGGTKTTESIITLTVDEHSQGGLDGSYSLLGPDGTLTITIGDTTPVEEGKPSYPSIWGTFKEPGDSGYFWFILTEDDDGSKRLNGAWIGEGKNPNPWWAELLI